MGYRVLLIAVTGKEPFAIHRDYSVAPTDQHESPDSPVTGTRLPSGAYLLYINDEILPDDQVFARLSQNASLLACYANETVMDSFVRSWVNGVEQWSVWHCAQQGLKHLETTGDIPAQFNPIRERLFAEQDKDKETDYISDIPTDYIFDIPIELFAELGGMRYNRDLEGAGPKPWQVLTRIKDPAKTAKKSWWPLG